MAKKAKTSKKSAGSSKSTVKKKKPRTKAQIENPGGQPTKYRPEYCQEIIEFMSTGKSMERFAVSIDVDVDTVREWARTRDDFSAAYKKAKILCAAWWEDFGMQNMYEKDFKHGMWIFWMKARHGWRETTEIITDDKKPKRAYDLSKMSPEEYREYLKNKIKEGK